MQLRLVSVTLSIVLACVSAAPVAPRHRIPMGSANGKSVGAAYCACHLIRQLFLMVNLNLVITNEPAGNFIVAADIGTDGKLVGCWLSTSVCWC